MKTKLLVIDDETGVLDMIRGHFELRGYEVFTAMDGKEEGTGLGLYITKQLVECNKGKISTETDVGKGTSFTIKYETIY